MLDVRRFVGVSLPILVLLAGGLNGGCSTAIGDSCQTSFDCSVNNDRICDTAQPGGACTVFGCEAESCPDDAVCVRWRPDPSRLSFTACMKVCNQESDCRTDESYQCRTADSITDAVSGEPLAEVLEDGSPTFCVATQPDTDL